MRGKRGWCTPAIYKEINGCYDRTEVTLFVQCNMFQESLDRILSSPEFAAAGRLSQLLRYLGEHSLAGSEGQLKETVIGVEVFGRDPGYDPKVDSVVRGEVRRLRLKLAEYYAGSGKQERGRLEIPKGGYRLIYVEDAPLAASVETPVSPPAEKPKRWWPMAIAACLALASVGGLGVKLDLFGSSLRKGDARQLTASVGQALTPSVTPDGKRVVFSYAAGDQSGIYWADLESGNFSPKRLPGTRARDFNPVIDATGQKIAFLREQEGRSYSVLVQGLEDERAEKWFTVDRRDRMQWLANGQKLIVSSRPEGQGAAILLRIDAQGERTPLLTPPPGTLYDGMPTISPDGRRLAFSRAPDASVEEIFLVDIDEAGNPQGPPRQITQEKRKFNGFCWSPGGEALIASARRDSSMRGLWRIPLSNPRLMERMPEAGMRAAYPVVAPRKRLVLYSISLDDLNLYRVDGEGAPPKAISPSLALDSSPSLSPDGEWVAFRSERSSSSEIWIARVDGSQAQKLTSYDGPVTGSPRWSPDGKWIAYDTRVNGNGDIFIVSRDGKSTRQITTETSNEMVPTWSRDGHRIYFASDRANLLQIWSVDAFQAGAPARQVTLAGGFRALESPDGKYLYYAKRKPKSGLWRMPLPSGAEEAVAPLDDSMWGGWALADKGYFLTQLQPIAEIRFHPFVGPAQSFARISNTPVHWDGSVDVSVDGRRLIFTQLDQAVADLYQLEVQP